MKFVTAEKSLMVHGKLKDFLIQLPKNNFEQIHKSYIISLSKVVYVEGNFVKVGAHKIPVSANFKEQLLIKLG